MLQTNRVQEPVTQPSLNGEILPAWDEIGRSALEIAPGLSAERQGRMLVLCWEHRGKVAGPSRVEFEIHLADKSGELCRQTLANILRLYQRDYLREKASNPVITAFFRGLAAKPGVALRGLQNCSVVNGTISFKTAASQTTLRNLELDSCRLALQAKLFEASEVTIGGASVLTLHMDRTRWQAVKIGRSCVMNGNLGHGVIEADCWVHSNHAENMNFRGIKWLESPEGPSLNQRMDDFVFCCGLVSEEFLQQGKHRILSEEESAELKTAARRRLDEAWG